MQLELPEVEHIEVLAVHGVLPGRAEKGVEVDLAHMPIGEGEADGVIAHVRSFLDADVVCDIHLMRRVMRSGLRAAA